MSDRDDNEGGDDYGDEESFQEEADIIEDGDEEFEEQEGGQGQHQKPRKSKIPDNERITSRFMTKYEKARILGTRAL